MLSFILSFILSPRVSLEHRWAAGDRAAARGGPCVRVCVGGVGMRGVFEFVGYSNLTSFDQFLTSVFDQDGQV